jgi:hypothetical protein
MTAAHPMSRELHTLELLLVLAAFMCVSAAGAAFQRPVSFNGGRAWDGVAYVAMAEQMSNGDWMPMERVAGKDREP